MCVGSVLFGSPCLTKPWSRFIMSLRAFSSRRACSVAVWLYYLSFTLFSASSLLMRFVDLNAEHVCGTLYSFQLSQWKKIELVLPYVFNRHRQANGFIHIQLVKRQDLINYWCNDSEVKSMVWWSTVAAFSGYTVYKSVQTFLIVDSSFKALFWKEKELEQSIEITPSWGIPQATVTVTAQ